MSFIRIIAKKKKGYDFIEKYGCYFEAKIKADKVIIKHKKGKRIIKRNDKRFDYEEVNNLILPNRSIYPMP